MKYVYVSLKWVLKVMLLCIHMLLKYSQYKEKSGGIYNIHFIHPNMLERVIQMEKQVFMNGIDTTEFPESNTGLAYISLFTLPFVVIGLKCTENMKIPSWYPCDVDWSAIALIFMLSTSLSYVIIRTFGYQIGKFVHTLYSRIDNTLIRLYDVY